ncbi:MULTISPECIES: nucleotidyltransferase substrate binding protein [Persicobacter]|uniref:Nucleotidyltransferase n=1 Tax=Persicobacter diffluens TaxID=981 RepID=A0AAN5AKN2_9BACT|nr:nucleotidyltransferase substrate binding protein [Persicobacter sp. CCB-QB2]GJM61992.1 nucleotidyltransferase [Persicobacter diffluens]
MEELRWKQRFENYQKALSYLELALDKEDVDEVTRAGIIQFFEMTLELAWKTMKDLLNEEGFEVKSPRETIKQSLQYGMIEEGHLWLDALQKRNLMAHTYDQASAVEAEDLIRNEYYPLMLALQSYLENK